MALIKCKECENEVSSTAKACPKCGAKVVTAKGIIGAIIVMVISLFAIYWLYTFQIGFVSSVFGVNQTDIKDSLKAGFLAGLFSQEEKPIKQAETAANANPPMYISLDPFTVNLVKENDAEYLQLIISVEVVDLSSGDKLILHTPKIRNNVLMLLSGKKASELLTRDGKEDLCNEIRDVMNEVLKGKVIMEVLMTSFTIQ